MAALPLTVELVLDQKSAAAVSSEAQKVVSEASRNITQEFNRSMSGVDIAEPLRRSTRQATNAMRDEMRSGLNDVVGSVTGQLGAMGRVADSTFAAMPGKAALAAAGVGGVGLAAVAVGKQLYDLGAQWDAIADGITLRTGRVGDSLTSLTDAVGDIGSTTAASLGSIGDVVGQLAQAMPDLAANSAVLRQMGSNLAYLAENGRAVNIGELGMAFNVFGVSASEAVGTLDDLNRVSQATGIPINELISTVRKGAPQFKQFGLDLGESTSLLASFSNAGLDPRVTLTGLQFALKSVGDDARGAAPALADAVTQIKALYDTGQAGNAQKLAQDTFGRENFAPFLDAIENGTLNADNLKTALDGVGLSVKDLQDQTDDGAQGFQKLWNTIQTEAGPAANTFFTFLNSQAMYLTGHLTDAADQLKDVASTPIDPNSALGRILTSGGVAIPGTGGPGSGVALPTGIGTGLTPDSGLFSANGLLAPNWGTNQVAGPPMDRSSSSPKLPDAPILPYDTSLPSGLANLPQTAELYSAESSFLDARHKAAEKQARLNQLEQDNVATERDKLDARNDLIQAQRGQNEAEARMYDAATKKAKDQTSQMEQIGAKLDDDFGVSKGLAGMADNITRFLLNLAMVPVMAQLKGVQAASGYDPANAGSGLMGVLGAQGAFGPQYTQEAQQAAISSSSGASASALGPAAWQPPGGGGGYPGDQALLANVKPGVYSQSPARDLLKGLSDCSSSIGDLVNIMDTGGTGGGQKLTTGNASQWLPQHGFQPGMGGPGDFRVGYNGGHMQATLPGGTPWNWGSDAAAARGGVGGSGATDPSFTDHYFRPGGGGASQAITNPALTPPGGVGWGGPGIPSGITGGGEGPIFGVPQGPGIGGGGAGGGGFGYGGGTQYDPMATLPGGSVPGQAGGNPLGGLTGGPGGAPGGGFGWGRGAPGAPGGGLGNAGAAPGQSVIGGRSFGQGTPASSGFGVGGGLIGAAAGAATGAANMFAPGAGAGAQIGIDLINRAVGAAGQYAGNAVGGVMETFMLNDSALADPGKSWLGKLAIGAAGARPALPNSAGSLGGAQNAAMAEAGKKPPPGPLTPEQAQAQQANGGAGGDPAKAGDTTNISVTNNRATEDGTGRDIQASLGANQASKQPR